MASKHIDIGPFTGWIIDHEGIKPASHVFVGSVDVDGNVYNWNCMRQGESYLQLGNSLSVDNGSAIIKFCCR